MRRGRPPKRNKKKAHYIFCFTFGVIVATFFPYKAIMLILSVILILLGIAYCRCP